MTKNEFDVLLTSYALGELEGEVKALVARKLAESAEARAQLAEITALSELLSRELAGQAAPGLDAGRRAAIEAAARGDRRRGLFLRLDARPWAAAAAILLALGGAFAFGVRGGDGGSSRGPIEVADGRGVDSGRGSREPVEGFEPKGAPEAERREVGLRPDLVVDPAAKPIDAGQEGGFVGLVTAEDQQADKRPQPALDPTRVDVEAAREQLEFKVGREAPAGPPARAGLGPAGSSVPVGGVAGPGAANAPGSGGRYTGPIGGGAGGESAGFKSPPATISPGAPTEQPRAEELARRARKKDATKGEVADRSPDSSVAVDAIEHDGETTVERFAIDIPGKMAELKNEVAKLPAEKQAEVRRLVESVESKTRELGDVGEKIRAHDPTTGASAAKLRAEVGEVHDYYARVRRYVDDEVRRAGGEDYSSVIEEPFKMALHEPLSTIGLDVDTASYANVRRFLNSGRWPPRDAVRVDEMLNYFSYADPGPEGEENLAIHAEVAACPWNLDNRLLRVAFKAKEIDRSKRGATSLVFLVDISGSMRSQDKLPLLKEGLKALARQLGEDDAVTIVTYASGVGVALEPTFGNDQGKILGVLDSLAAGGSTNGAGGIQLAYEMAQKAFVSGGTNRVILCTDGDFNVGVSDTNELTRMIEEKAKSGVFLSVLGFGTGNLQDGRMQALANKGNGHYAYIDSKREVEKVLVEELCGTLVTVAKDAKLQVEFNPAEVSSWRLLGYSARILEAQDFNDDRKDAGEIGAGHSVVALYEIAPRSGADDEAPKVDPLKYRDEAAVANRGAPGEIATVKLRYKMPEAEKSRLMTLTVIDEGRHYGAASIDFKLSASVALFGQILFRSPFVGTTGLEAAEELARESIGKDGDPRGLRREFGELIRKAIAIRAAAAPQR